MNVREAVAVCRGCGAVTKLSLFAEEPELAGVDITRVPDGCEIVELGDRLEVRASTRSLGSAVAVALFGLFWNGIVSVFVLIAIAGSLHAAGVGVPSWFPSPSTKGGGMITLGGVIFLWIFLIPFLSIGLLLIAVFLVSVAGKCEVIIESGRGTAGVGIGPVQWRQRFNAAAVTSVRTGQTNWKQNEQSKPLVLIKADKEVKFGSGLREDRRLWVTAVLSQALTGEGRERRPWLSSGRT